MGTFSCRAPRDEPPLGVARNTSRIPLEGGAEEEQEHFSLGVLKLS